MFASISVLQYWKSEHERSTCEDAWAADSDRGLFAVADGAGTTLFAHLWARALVQAFCELPLLSVDPFEVEWWLSRVQERYQQELPALAELPWHARQKLLREGSHATLVTLRIVEDGPTALEAVLQAFGDSCALIQRAATGEIESFPLGSVDEFDRPPICLPSLPALFQRRFHRGSERTLTLASGDRVMLATDAVACWIIGGANGRYAPGEVFEMVASQGPASWPAFVHDCRERFKMRDDDCTVLLLELSAESRDPEARRPGVTSGHAPLVLQQRREAFEEACRQGDRKSQAILYGDGGDLQQAGLQHPAQEIALARQVADALAEMVARLRPLLNRPDATAAASALWAQYAPLLAAEPCAAPLRQTLQMLGVVMPSPAAVEPTASPEPPQAPDPATDDVTMRMVPLKPRNADDRTGEG